MKTIDMQLVRESEDPEVLAQEYVDLGLATPIDIGKDSMIATCGKATKKLSVGSRDLGWQSIYARFELGPTDKYVLHADDTRVIVVGGFDGDGLSGFIDWMESAQREFDTLHADEETLFRDGDSGRFDGNG